MTPKFTEAQLEKAVIELLAEEGYPHITGEDINRSLSEVLLTSDLQQYLRHRYAHQGISPTEIQSIIRQLDILPSSALYDSNKQVMKWLSDGFLFRREDRDQQDLYLQLIDFENDDNNIYKVVTQLEIEEYHKRIPDAILYVNGLPLVVFEFKSAIRETVNIEEAFKQITIRYKRDIPELFKYNAICIISDGVNSRSGSLFAGYDFYYAWRKIDGTEGKEVDGIRSLYTLIKGLLNKNRLRDVLHHFIYLPDTTTKETKILCRYPQYYGTHALYESILAHRKPHGDGKGGTYFGATGCGKSFTMLFLTRLLMKSIELGSPTILIITDRNDLDDQISATFTNAKGYIGDDNIVSINSRDHLRELLKGRKSGGVFLTTIQKFTEDEEPLTERNNVICISDEAHRSQINLEESIKVTSKGVFKKRGFAYYLHASLPNATYVGFTGTPVDQTLEVFGGIVDYYTMSDSVRDGITERIVYEGRAAKVILDNAKIKEIEDYYDQCVAEGASEYQVEESKKATTVMETILGDPDRLTMLAKDFVAHYDKRVEEGSTVVGKAMFVATSRHIAYDFYKRVIALRPEWAVAKIPEGLSEADAKETKPIEMMKMVMTRNKDDKETLYKLFGTKDYRKELDRQFKDERSNFKIAIVVDMWLTGFDVPFLDTIYIDKPIQMHNLIQTISRVNRKYKGKNRGLVVDYIGIKSRMNKALKEYSKVDEEDFADVEKAVNEVHNMLALLGNIFHHFDTHDYFHGTPLVQLDCLNRGAEYIQQSNKLEKRFMNIVKKLKAAFDLCTSSELITRSQREHIHFYLAIRSIIFKLTRGNAPDITQMNARVRQMIDEALKSDGVEEVFKIEEGAANQEIDIFSEEHLNKVNAIKLPNTKIKMLQRLLKMAIDEFKKVNKVKGVDFTKRLQRIVEKYNEREGFPVAEDVHEDVVDELVNLFKAMNTERTSYEAMGIDFEEKAFYDILKTVAERHKFEFPHDKLITLAQAIKSIVDDKSKYTDWSQREDIKAELQVAIILILDKHGYPPVPRDDVFKEILEQAEHFKKGR